MHTNLRMRAEKAEHLEWRLQMTDLSFRRRCATGPRDLEVVWGRDGPQLQEHRPNKFEAHWFRLITASYEFQRWR
jgi:hypothetical protein